MAKPMAWALEVPGEVTWYLPLAMPMMLLPPALVAGNQPALLSKLSCSTRLMKLGALGCAVVTVTATAPLAALSLPALSVCLAVKL